MRDRLRKRRTSASRLRLGCPGAVGGQPMTPVFELNAQRLADENRPKSSTVNKEITLNGLAAIHFELGDIS